MSVETMKDIINYAAEQYGDQDAFRYKVKKEIHGKTYRQLKEDTESFSRSLDKLGLLGKHVAVVGATSYPWVVSYFGTANSGGVIVPLDAGLPAGDLCQLINRADVSVLVYDESREDVAQAAGEKCPGLVCLISMKAAEHKTEEALPVYSFEKLVEENRGPKLCSSIIFN